jgi:hypothetical protein
MEASRAGTQRRCPERHRKEVRVVSLVTMTRTTKKQSDWDKEGAPKQVSCRDDSTLKIPWCDLEELLRRGV